MIFFSEGYATMSIGGSGGFHSGRRGRWYVAVYRARPGRLSYRIESKNRPMLDDAAIETTEEVAATRPSAKGDVNSNAVPRARDRNALPDY
jgi:hypothetical protein